MSMTRFIPKRLRKNGISSIHTISESCDSDMSTLVCSTANAPAYSSMSPKPLIYVFAKPFDTCNAAPNRTENTKNNAILRLRNSPKASSPNIDTRDLLRSPTETGQSGNVNEYTATITPQTAEAKNWL